MIVQGINSPDAANMQVVFIKAPANAREIENPQVYAGNTGGAIIALVDSRGNVIREYPNTVTTQSQPSAPQVTTSNRDATDFAKDTGNILPAEGGGVTPIKKKSNLLPLGIAVLLGIAILK